MRRIIVLLFICSGLLQAAAQNVGIGTNTPAAKLQVAGNVAIDSGLRVNAKNVRVPFLVEGSPINYSFTDQQSLQNDGHSLSTNPAWQTFTAGATGTLVRLELFHGGSKNTPYDINIYSGVGTQGTLIYTRTVDVAGGWLSIMFMSVPLVAGQTYTIYLSQGDLWAYSNTDSYSGGISSHGSSRDYVFKTVMDNINDQLLRIGDNGNVGISVPVPTERLEVRGNIKSSGMLIAGNGVMVNGNVEINGFIMQSNSVSFNLLNGWQNYGETYGNANFSIDKQKVVRLSGLVKNGTSPIIAQLPNGVRPPTDLTFTVVSGNGFARLDVKANGNVQLMGSYSNLFVSLDGVSFRVN